MGTINAVICSSKSLSTCYVKLEAIYSILHFMTWLFCSVGGYDHRYWPIASTFFSATSTLCTPHSSSTSKTETMVLTKYYHESIFYTLYLPFPGIVQTRLANVKDIHPRLNMIVDVVHCRV
ncbi:hypothetical protein M378DRAFT_341644 [Amanita muscaria Koide BX008]|uniref:Uncharacterized protein n=1 Tax=Amanita muscaria (strain Koide BX008) TaxID=946122 RepID=A0A0C2WMY2_AMAMK|nr:hypothetical protein M378DRAFT_341644 [Amanita muscaria Koide BX008]